MWQCFVRGDFDLCISNEILSEYIEILAQKSGAAFAALVGDFLVSCPNVLRIEPDYRFNLIQVDKDDNKFVDCAIAANAEYIVSEDKHYKVLESIPFPKVGVITLEAFTALLNATNPLMQ